MTGTVRLDRVGRILGLGSAMPLPAVKDWGQIEFAVRMGLLRVTRLSVGTSSYISGLTDISGSWTPGPVPSVAHLRVPHLGGKA